MDWFAGGAVVITGAGSGIGRAAAEAFAKAGCDIIVADIDGDLAERTAQAVRQMGRRATAYPLDVSDSTQVSTFADQVHEEWDRIDILINNAGVTLRPFRSAWEASEEDWRWVMGINFWGVLHGVRAFVPKMLAQPGRKHIVNTSSVAPLLAIGGHAPYTASKAAIDGLSASLRSELAGSNIGVTLLVPGYVETNLAESERLRPAADRSAHRAVTPFIRSKQEPQVDARQRLSEAANKLVSAEAVGDMLVEAIRTNRPYCVTHALHKEDLETLTGELAQA